MRKIEYHLTYYLATKDPLQCRDICSLWCSGIFISVVIYLFLHSLINRTSKDYLVVRQNCLQRKSKSFCHHHLTMMVTKWFLRVGTLDIHVNINGKYQIYMVLIHTGQGTNKNLKKRSREIIIIIDQWGSIWIGKVYPLPFAIH
jgi:hypothetical protein